MIYQNTLMSGIEYRIKNASNLTIQDIQHLITLRANAYGIPIDFKSDFISSGVVFRLLGDKEEVLVLFNPETNDRLRYVLQFNRQGTYLFMQVNKTNGFAADGAASSSYNAARSAFPGYTHWYTIVDDIFEELFT